jgi:hypothetical protein
MCFANRSSDSSLYCFGLVGGRRGRLVYAPWKTRCADLHHPLYRTHAWPCLTWRRQISILSSNRCEYRHVQSPETCPQILRFSSGRCRHNPSNLSSDPQGNQGVRLVRNTNLGQSITQRVGIVCKDQKRATFTGQASKQASKQAGAERSSNPSFQHCTQTINPRNENNLSLQLLM